MNVSGLGALVRTSRRQAGFTQQELAHRAGLSVAALRDIEQGRVKQPRASTLRSLVETLGLERADSDALVRAGTPADVIQCGLRVDILGPLRVAVDGVPVDPGGEAQRTLLGVLALSANEEVGHAALVEAARRARPSSSAHGSLSSRISRLRRRLQPGRAGHGSARMLAAGPAGYRLAVTEDQLDLLAFRRVVARARQERDVGALAKACALFRYASELWRGEPLADVAVLGNRPAVSALSRERRAVVVEYAAVAARLGRHAEVLPHLRQVTDSDPLNEAAHTALMIALSGCGQRDAALAEFDRLRRSLVEELGTDPGPELEAAYRQVLRRDAATEPVTVSTRHRLPPDTPGFIGRSTELHVLRENLDRETRSGTALPICIIQGMPGVGKTRLAVRFAHRLLAEGRYPDRQLYADLRGRSQEPPADPSSVLASLLGIVGVPTDRTPDSVDDRTAMYRDRLHGTRTLVLLDDAESEDQVAPLLPASPDALVLVTSRRALALDGAFTLTLDVFSPAEGKELLTTVAGPGRLASAPAVPERLVELCGRLPLAVALAASRLRNSPGHGIGEGPGLLGRARVGREENEPATRDVHAVFGRSYRALDADGRRMFRLLSLHPGADFSAESAAALCDVDPARAQRLLDQLADEHLVVVAARNRYQMHDLLAEYARRLTERVDPEPARHAATARVLSCHLPR
ncbi:BTAD domain-containing putative transcriptional regulator [Streptomonospora wellingtoniae]|uniref:BTAD domain-containing putative transcriptional regulator n=1 Tax=Streptomonospora wellingtoniae TaxID=3075544 RepID=A0ABU2KWD2_9ACTN|nr:BTAD domain-containing putative transcriptional regulator [Streptomonospora sp. DSM 45055]MDT0303594.1 BTAD domain-containing putative transcriptional regulator [Streptomonospora sp. DSM 45055]